MIRTVLLLLLVAGCTDTVTREPNMSFPETCTIQDAFTCTDWHVDGGTNTVSFVIQAHAHAERVGVALDTRDCRIQQDSIDIGTLGAQEEMPVTFSCDALTQGQRFEAVLHIIFSEDEERRVVSGELHATTRDIRERVYT